MFEVLLEIRVSRCTSACQCSGGSSPELSADLELQPGERADRPRRASLCHRQGSHHHHPLAEGILSEGTAVLPHRRPD